MVNLSYTFDIKANFIQDGLNNHTRFVKLPYNNYLDSACSISPMLTITENVISRLQYPYLLNQCIPTESGTCAFNLSSYVPCYIKIGSRCVVESGYKCVKTASLIPLP